METARTEGDEVWARRFGALEAWFGCVKRASEIKGVPVRVVFVNAFSGVALDYEVGPELALYSVQELAAWAGLESPVLSLQGMALESFVARELSLREDAGGKGFEEISAASGFKEFQEGLLGMEARSARERLEFLASEWTAGQGTRKTAMGL